mmetsp:Transcript_10898/g.45385  ORF Transcript_10898/g.45385 Transcript_10898/m.45385 type:complete len:201 (+) Transcript_10898:650-1252(+)
MERLRSTREIWARTRSRRRWRGRGRSVSARTTAAWATVAGSGTDAWRRSRWTGAGPRRRRNRIVERLARQRRAPRQRRRRRRRRPPPPRPSPPAVRAGSTSPRSSPAAAAAAARPRLPRPPARRRFCEGSAAPTGVPSPVFSPRDSPRSPRVRTCGSKGTRGAWRRRWRRAGTSPRSLTWPPPRWTRRPSRGVTRLSRWN